MRSGAERNLAYPDIFYREEGQEGQRQFIWSAGRADYGGGAGGKPTTRTLPQ
jgi:hypothetical protein